MSGCRAVITGLGPVSAIGTGVGAFWEALVAGRSGTRPLTRCAPPRRGCAVAAEVADPAPLPFDVHNPVPRSVQLALHAARLALEDAASQTFTWKPVPPSYRYVLEA